MTTTERRLTRRVRSLLGERRHRDVLSPVAARIAKAAARGRTRSAGPYVTLSVGGPLNGTVTLTATESGRVRVAAAWRAADEPSCIALTRSAERDALIVANAWADQLINGRVPTPQPSRTFVGS